MSGVELIASVLEAVDARLREADFGPFDVYFAASFERVLHSDYTPYLCCTVGERIMQIDLVKSVRISRRMPEGWLALHSHDTSY